ncbi:hypothetical protein ACLVWU_04675 [Bdellovibrio sp. HCB290]|uniref:hypothetical protein n=1 Tax=Bdellovibrio sp. HCB290 TaxID=3394356 RepID=UPI0039B3B44E
MKSIFFSFIFLLSAPAFAQEYRALQNVGAIPQGSEIKVQAVKPKNEFFNPKNLNPESPTDIPTIKRDTLLSVNSIKSKTKSADVDVLKDLAENDGLVVEKSAFSANDQSCITKGTCTLNSDTKVYQSSSFNFFDWLRDIFGMGEVKSLVTPTIDERTNPKSAAALVMNEKATQANRAMSGQDKSCTELAPELKYNRLFQCGLAQALDAHRKNMATGKVTSDTFIFNDFKNGELTGKMYFFNSKGELAQVLPKSPIPVARGVNEFGANFRQTPNGAIVTRAYRPPRAGNINDGIELLGLENGNMNIHGRGVLLHGADPYAPTWGCLGVAGSYDSDSAGKEERGGRPLYLDELKSGLLKNGGVMIYNFTPNKAAQCK